MSKLRLWLSFRFMQGRICVGTPRQAPPPVHRRGDLDGRSTPPPRLADRPGAARVPLRPRAPSLVCLLPLKFLVLLCVTIRAQSRDNHRIMQWDQAPPPENYMKRPKPCVVQSRLARGAVADRACGVRAPALFVVRRKGPKPVLRQGNRSRVAQPQQCVSERKGHAASGTVAFGSGSRH